MIALRPKTKIKQIVHTCIGDYLPAVKRILGKWLKKYPFAEVKAAPDVYAWKDCLGKYAPNPPAVKIGFEDVAMYQYTGGTTGVSKGVMLTHANLSKQVQQIEAWFPKFGKGGEIILGALPYFHVFGLSLVMNYAVYQGMGAGPGSPAPAGAAPGGDPELPSHLCAAGAHDVHRDAEPSGSQEDGHELHQGGLLRERAAARRGDP